LQNHIAVTATNEGLRLELTESATGTYFQGGSAKMSLDGGDLLKTLAPEPGKLLNDVATEGHTDAKAYPALAL
jgi:flagellar motor protein MotB